MPILALDFDGVVCDSMDECLLTAWNAYARGGSLIRAATLSGVPEDFRKEFRRWRYLVRPARHYWLLAHRIVHGESFSTQEEFDRAADANAPHMVEFQQAFDAERERLREESMERWLGLHRLYPEFSGAWSEVKEAWDVHVVTMKDAASVSLLSERWDLGIEPERIWGRDRSDSKPAALREICRRAGVEPDSATFVDDHPVHLDEISPLGATCYWAEWGYHRGARNVPYPVLHNLGALVGASCS